ncbi:MAG TPA: hypothetical protein VFN77_03995 [Acetobacteraceae bacterium]|nr:hypothetical protein [Acetobacteraceae bacterium]
MIRIRRLAPLLALASLAACSSEHKPPLFCPKVAVLSEASHLIRPASAANDVAARTLDARITGVAGSCRTKGRRRAELSFRIGFAATQGPASTSPRADLTYFIALIQGDTIIDKKLYPVSFDFKGGTEQAVATTTPIRIVVPNAPRSARQQVLVGFQLSRAELNSVQP